MLSFKYYIFYFNKNAYNNKVEAERLGVRGIVNTKRTMIYVFWRVEYHSTHETRTE